MVKKLCALDPGGRTDAFDGCAPVQGDQPIRREVPSACHRPLNSSISATRDKISGVIGMEAVSTSNYAAIRRKQDHGCSSTRTMINGLTHSQPIKTPSGSRAREPKSRSQMPAGAATMPKHYWHNLPEAELIPGLIAQALGHVEAMIVRSQVQSPADD